ncbi:hypothetical protein NQ314_014879 [Rhamnusium bicolor]|uniref:DUF4485 domain-containing protein n=1 Tax=Rhamnusium bicolor TaxID=1586634 RepID=A0AAV8X0U6_9CUCU|nr:hypothetical protein NQ314_014879 [Rhamnusium bicolor]
MSNPIKALNEHFYYNARLARAMQQLLTANERKSIELWFDKLLDMDKTTEQMPLHVYEDVLISNEPNMIYIDRKNSRNSLFSIKEKAATATSCSSIDNHL